MAFVLLAIGALMSAGGIYAVVSGYPIIQVEEGWASVISGATLITGGVLTIALALVLRALNEVKAAVRLSPATILATDTASFAGPLPPPPLEVPMPPIATLPETARPETARPETARPETARPETARPETEGPETAGAETAGHGDAFPLAPAVVAERPEDPPLAAVAPEPWQTAGHDLMPEVLADEAATTPHPEAEPRLETPRPADDYKLETPSTSEHDIPSDRHEPFPLRETPASPPMDDWLDRAFAELDRDTPSMSPAPQAIRPTRARSQAANLQTTNLQTTKPETRKPMLAPAIAEPAHQRQSMAPDPAPPAAAQPSAPADRAEETQESASHAATAVIGRYESEGTMYVMYADGSIEAQSASGVYRFASMSELKSFIET